MCSKHFTYWPPRSLCILLPKAQVRLEWYLVPVYLFVSGHLHHLSVLISNHLIWNFLVWLLLASRSESWAQMFPLQSLLYSPLVPLVCRGFLFLLYYCIYPFIHHQKSRDGCVLEGGYSLSSHLWSHRVLLLNIPAQSEHRSPFYLETFSSRYFHGNCTIPINFLSKRHFLIMSP